MADGYSTGRRLVHGWAIATAGVTFVLLCSGGLVTSHNAGLAVPDWPNSFGYNMFALPFSHWVGGVFLEHSHRLLGTLVGFLTAVLAGWLWVLDSPRGQRWPGLVSVLLVIVLLGVRQMSVYVTLAVAVPIVVVWGLVAYRRDGGRLRWLGIVALAAVVLQGVLGGLRVERRADEIGIFHGLVAQAYFAFACLLVIMTSRSFRQKAWAVFAPDGVLRRWVYLATAMIFVQLGLGATMRHEHIGLSIPDFPPAYGRFLPDTSPAALERINATRIAEGEMAVDAVQIWVQMVHRFVAVLILAAVIAATVKARPAARVIRIWTTVWLGMICVQIALGAWTIWSAKAADIATMHMALGALSLVVGAMLSFRLYCGGRAQDFIAPDVPLSHRYA